MVEVEPLFEKRAATKLDTIMLNLQSILTSQTDKPLVVVFPHPDDETVMAGGLMQRAVSLGRRVVSVTLTRGEAGRLHIHGGGQSIAAIRRDELEKALQILGVKEFHSWNYGDGRLSLWEAWQGPLVELLESLKPSQIVTYDLSGVSGHPDHIATSLFVTEWVRSQAISPQLFFPSFDAPIREQIEAQSMTGEYMGHPTHELKLTPLELESKRQAILAHRSQDLSTPLLWLETGSEWFHCFQKDCEYAYKFVEYDLGA